MDLIRYSELEKRFSEETDGSSSEQQNNDNETGTGRSYECIFCKRGFTTAQALGGHMNIHRKDKANKSKPTTFPLSSSINNNYEDLRFYSEIPSHDPLVGNNNYCQVYLPSTACGIKPSHVQYSEENQQDHIHMFGQDWRQRNFSLHTTNPFCDGEIKDNFQEDGLDLELRLGRHP